jgi:hypothetical protein
MNCIANFSARAVVKLAAKDFDITSREKEHWYPEAAFEQYCST